MNFPFTSLSITVVLLIYAFSAKCATPFFPEKSLKQTSATAFASGANNPETNFVISASKILKPGIQAPEFQLNSLEKDIVNLSDFQGKIVVLAFIKEDCYGCKKALPELQKLQDKYNKSGVTVLGINPDLGANPTDTVIALFKVFLKQRDVKLTILTSSPDIEQLYKIEDYPTFYIINDEGIIVHAAKGYNSSFYEQFSDIIKSLF